MKEILSTCIQAYQDAIEFIENEGCEDFKKIKFYLNKNKLTFGICAFVSENFPISETEEFVSKIFPTHFITYMFQSCNDWFIYLSFEKSSKDLIETCLQPRLDFLKEKLIELETTNQND